MEVRPRVERVRRRCHRLQRHCDAPGRQPRQFAGDVDLRPAEALVRPHRDALGAARVAEPQTRPAVDSTEAGVRGVRRRHRHRGRHAEIERRPADRHLPGREVVVPEKQRPLGGDLQQQVRRRRPADPDVRVHPGRDRRRRVPPVDDSEGRKHTGRRQPVRHGHVEFERIPRRPAHRRRQRHRGVVACDHRERRRGDQPVEGIPRRRLGHLQLLRLPVEGPAPRPDPVRPRHEHRPRRDNRAGRVAADEVKPVHAERLEARADRRHDGVDAPSGEALRECDRVRPRGPAAARTGPGRATAARSPPAGAPGR